MSPLETVLAKLGEPSRTGRDSFEAPCPVHGDTGGRLIVTQAADQSVALRCPAGCHRADVLRELELGEADLLGSQGEEPREQPGKQRDRVRDADSRTSQAGSGSQPKAGTGNHTRRHGSGNQQEPGGTTTKFDTLDAFIARALAEPELTYLVQGLVPDRGRVLMVAPPNAGKTWLALVIAKTASHAGRSVLFIEEEGSRRKLGERLQSMAFPEGAPLRIAHLAGLKLDDARVRAELVGLLEQESAPVMVLDPLTSLWSGDENDTREANKLRAHLDELANANPSALIVVLHHTSKAATNGDGHEINAARGSSVFAGWADVQLNLAHAQGPKGCIALAVLVAKNRDGERGQRVNVRIELGSGEVSLDDAQPAEDLDERIAAALKEAPGGLTKNGITKSVKGRKGTVLARVDALLAEGRVVKVGDTFRRCEPQPASARQAEDGEDGS